MTQEEHIIEKTEKAFGLEAGKICSKDRTRHVSEARDACIWLIKERLKVPNGKIGIVIGFRLPSTIVYSLKRTRQRLDRDLAKDEPFKDRLTVSRRLCGKR